MPHCHSLIQTLRQLGYRMTPQREMIIEAIAHARGHMTAEEIHEQIKTRTQAVNIATIYRTLDLLVEQGLATRSDLWDGRVVYAASHHGPHIHLVCRHCGEIYNADQTLLLSLGKALNEQYSFHADLQHLSIVGLCSECQAKTQSR